MWSVVHQGQVLDVVCRRHPAVKGSDFHSKWYLVYVGDTLLGQVIPISGGWDAICQTDSQYNWLAKGYASRRKAIEYLLRAAGYWEKDR